MSRDSFDSTGRDHTPAGDLSPHGDRLHADDPLRRALHAAAPPPPVNDVDWMALHARITAAARPTLDAVAAGRSLDVVNVDAAAATSAAGKTGGSVWLPLAGWSPLGIPMAAAAAVLLVLGATLLADAPAPRVSAVASSFRTIEEEFASGLDYGVGAMLAGGTDDVLDAVLFLDGEDW